MKTARDVANWVGNAVSDIAYDQVQMWKDYGDMNPEFDKMKADGCRDVAGAYADTLYNDPYTLADLMGTEVCAVIGIDDTPARKKFVNDLRKQHSFPAWQKACDMIDR